MSFLGLNEINGYNLIHYMTGTLGCYDSQFPKDPSSFTIPTEDIEMNNLDKPSSESELKDVVEEVPKEKDSIKAKKKDKKKKLKDTADKADKEIKKKEKKGKTVKVKKERPKLWKRIGVGASFGFTTLITNYLNLQVPSILASEITGLVAKNAVREIEDNRKKFALLASATSLGYGLDYLMYLEGLPPLQLGSILGAISTSAVDRELNLALKGVGKDPDGNKIKTPRSVKTLAAVAAAVATITFSLAAFGFTPVLVNAGLNTLTTALKHLSKKGSPKITLTALSGATVTGAVWDLVANIYGLWTMKFGTLAGSLLVKDVTRRVESFQMGGEVDEDEGEVEGGAKPQPAMIQTAMTASVWTSAVLAQMARDYVSSVFVAGLDKAGARLFRNQMTQFPFKVSLPLSLTISAVSAVTGGLFHLMGSYTGLTILHYLGYGCQGVTVSSLFGEVRTWVNGAKTDPQLETESPSTDRESLMGRVGRVVAGMQTQLANTMTKLRMYFIKTHKQEVSLLDNVDLVEVV